MPAASLPDIPVRPSVPTIAVDLRALVGVPTGIGVYTREILLELAKTGRFRLLGMSHRPIAAEEAERLVAAGIVLDVEPAPLGVLWQQLRFAPRRPGAWDADLLWSPLQTLPWVTGLPAVVTVHDLTVILKPETHRQRVVWSQRPFLRRSFATARAVVTVSRATARDVRRFAPESESRIIPIASGVDAKFRPDAEARARVRAELELPHGYLLYAGTLEPRKNLGILFRAWEALRSEITDPGGEGLPPLLVVGPTGWKTDAILSEIQRLSPQGTPRVGAGLRGAADRAHAGGVGVRLPVALRGIRSAAARGAGLRRSDRGLGRLEPARGGGQRRTARPRRTSTPGRAP